MKTINLYFDFEFTSLSPDAQPISLGIVSDDYYTTVPEYNKELGSLKLKANDPFGSNAGNKSFYAEFSDFDINRCDDWVKENVVSKLVFKDKPIKGETSWLNPHKENFEAKGDFNYVSRILKDFLEIYFFDYQIQFVCDCGVWDWYWMVQLLAEWDIKKEFCFTMEEQQLTKSIYARHEEELKLFRKAGSREIIQERQSGPLLTDNTVDAYRVSMSCSHPVYILTKTGLPKLPANISPVPTDLNDLIAFKKGITPKEAFDLNREYLSGERMDSPAKQKHNALWDAKVIKEIYNNLK